MCVYMYISTYFIEPIFYAFTLSCQICAMQISSSDIIVKKENIYKRANMYKIYIVIQVRYLIVFLCKKI